MKSLIIPALLLWGAIGFSSAQVLYTENFDDAGAAGRWKLENSSGSRTNPTPTGIAGLNYNNSGVNNDNCNNFWVLNDAHTPTGTTGSYASRRANCSGVNSSNKSLHITYRKKTDCNAGATSISETDYQNVTGYGSADAYYADAYWWIPTSDGQSQSRSDQFASMTPGSGFSTLGKCNVVVEFDAFLGGDGNPPLSDRSVLFSTDNGVTWQMAMANIDFDFNTAGQCNQWKRVRVGLPAAANNKASVLLAFRWRNDLISTPQGSFANGSRSSAFNIDNIEVKIGSNPTPGFTTDNRTPCKTQPLTLQDTSATNGLALTYIWTISPSAGVSFLSGTSANSPSPVVSFANDGSYTVTLNLQTSCGDNFTTPAKTAYITVGPCVPRAAIISNYDELCSTSPAPVSGSVTTVTFRDNSTAPLPGYAPSSYSWNFGSGATPATATGPGPHNVTYATTGTKTVTLIATNVDGPSTPATKTIDIIDCQCSTGGSGSAARVELIYEHFASSLSANWSGSGGGNPWQANSIYNCLLFGFFNIGSAPSQPTQITNPNTGFAAVRNASVGNGPCYDTGSGSSSTVTLTVPGAAGKTNFKLYYWYFTGSGNALSIQMSVDGGAFTSLKNLTGSTNWKQDSVITIVASPTTSLRFRFSFSGGGGDPSAGLDDVRVTADDAGGGGGGPGVFTCPVSGPICAGNVITIPFNANGTYNAGNVFTAQLSNAAGSFTSPTPLSPTLSGATAVGTNLTGRSINATIPAGTPLGTGYRVRVVSSNPTMSTLQDNGTDIEIINTPAAQTPVGSTNVCTGSTGNKYYAPSLNASYTYTWTVTGGTITDKPSIDTIVVSWNTTAGNGTVALTVGNSCGSSPGSLTVQKVNGQPVTSAITGPASACIGDVVTYSVASNSGSSYVWTVPTGGTIQSGQGTNSITVSWAGASAGPKIVSVTESNACGDGTPVSLGTTIFSAPPSGLTISGPVTLLKSQITGTNRFTYAASPFQFGVTYDWQVIPNPTLDSTSTVGKNSTTVNIDWDETTAPGAAPAYATLRVTATTGCSSVSFDTLISVITPTTIEQVQTPTIACSGSTVNLDFVTTGGAFDAANVFRVEYTTNKNNWTGATIASKTLGGSALTPPASRIPITLSAGTFPPGKYYFRVISTKPALTSSGAQAIDSIDVVLPPNSFTLNVNNSTVCTGSTVNFTLLSSEVGVNYYLETGGSQVGASVPGTGSGLSFNNIGPITANTTYRVMGVRNPCTAIPASPNVTVTIDTNPITTYTVSTTTPTVCLGDPVVITVSGSETGTSYQLLKDGIPEGSAVPGTGSALTFNAASITADATYSIRATRGVCPPATFGNATVDLLVATAPTTFTLSAPATTVCQTNTVVFTISGSQSGFEYRLENATTSATLQSLPGTGGALVFSAVTPAGPSTSYRVRAFLAPCVDDIVSNTVMINVSTPPSTFTLSANPATICFSGPTQLTLSGSQTGFTYQLLQNGNPLGAAVPGTGNPLNFNIANLSATATYSVRTNATACPAATMGNATVTVVQQSSIPAPSFTFSNNPEEVNVPVLFNSSVPVGGGITVSYTVNGAASGSSHVFTAPGVYIVRQTVTDANGCTRVLDQTIEIRDSRTIKLPNAFSPNNDGSNDLFEIQPGVLESLTFTVYNRWGLQVFDTHDTGIRWNGRDANGNQLPEGVYVYVLVATSYNGDEIKRSGSITLVR